MKAQLLVIFLCLSTICLSAQGRKCYGNSPCSACSTCNYCKHCNEGGGTCGVCSGSNHKRYDYKPNKSGGNPTYKYPSGNTPSGTIKKVGDVYKVTASTLNLRSGPSTSYAVIKELPFGTLVSLLSTEGVWLQIKVVSSGETGYVHSSYIKKN